MHNKHDQNFKNQISINLNCKSNFFHQYLYPNYILQLNLILYLYIP